MKSSKFNIITRGKDDPGKYLLYNTLHDHRILFEDPNLNPETLFDKINKHLPLNSQEQEAVPELKEMGVLLDDDADEQKVFEEWYHAKIRERTDIMQLTILPLMACNLACHYCFENAVREKGKMSPETAEKVIAWTRRRLEKYRPQKLHVTYFGGEPLLHTPPIKKITKDLWATCQELGVEMDMGMVTNGVLLTPELVDELVPYGFKWVKITFDGDKEAHDHKRIWHNGRGTFDTIYNNLCAIKGKLKMAIGGNFDAENYDSMFSLLERLKSSPFADDIMIARFKPIMKINPVLASQREGGGRVTNFCDVCAFNEEQTHGILSLQKKTMEVGFPIVDRPEIGPCEYHMRHHVTIGPDGNLYKCPGFVGLKNLTAGNIDQDEYNKEGEKELTARKWDDDCESCHFLPNCAGGCKMASLNQTGSIFVKSCDYEFLKKSTEEFMQREIVTLSEGSSQTSLFESPAT
jgi:uncharacterized protein